MSDEHDNGETALVPYQEPEPGSTISTISEWDNRGLSVRTSIDTTTDDGMALFVNAMAGSDVQLQQATGTEIVVTDYVVHVRERVDDATGEVTPALRLCLILDDGRIVAGGSRPVIDAWAWVHRQFGGRKPFPKLGVTLGRVGTPGKKGSYIRIEKVRVMSPTPTKQKK